MAWPVCPGCRSAPTKRADGGNLHVVDEGYEWTDVGLKIYRSYRCRCGWQAWSAEALIEGRPETLRFDRKFALPVARTPVTSEE